jgi:hypothetical protein
LGRWLGEYCIYNHPGKALLDVTTIPPFCPLPDYDVPEEEEEKEEEPRQYRCEQCGELFDHKIFSHGRPDYDSDGDVIEAECGPISEVPVVPKEAK